MSNQCKIIEVLNGKQFTIPPIWLMRQAGRYLPEYRQTRQQAGSFLDLCYNPDLATEVTLQPIERYNFDAAILFSDILVIPDALKRSVHFVTGEGPKMRPISVEEIDQLKNFDEDINAYLEPVFQAVTKIRSRLSADKALLGFCGAPWTVATYMIAGHGTPDQKPAKQFFYKNPNAFLILLDILADISADYLGAQIDAGVDAVQIFDSWSGVLDHASFELCCVKPVRRLVDRLRSTHPDAKIIGFPKGCGSFYQEYRAKTDIDCLGLDWSISWDLARELQKEGPVQGNLDPLRLLVGGEALKTGVAEILENLGSGPLIFNLGHGITPDVPLGHVHEMLNLVRSN